MAGIKVKQNEVFKVNTDYLKYYNWEINIDKNKAKDLEFLIKLFDSQMFELIRIILKNKGTKKFDTTDYVVSLVVDKIEDYDYVVKNGFFINGNKFLKFVGTTGGLKNNTVLFVNETIIEELNKRCECGRKNIPLVPSKYEAYKSLTCSSSQKIINPKKIIVVKDCIVKFNDVVINLDDKDMKTKGKRDKTKNELLNELIETEIENNISDGFNLCSIEYMKKVSESLGLDYIPSGVCLRNAWIKGMMYPFPIKEFVEKFNGGNYDIIDAWGQPQNLKDVDMILTESSFKLYEAYDNIAHYISCCKKNGYGFRVTKISPKELEDERELNYQYLQSYDFSDKDIEELCNYTVDFLKKSMGGDYDSTIKFLGIDGNSEDGSWQQALFTNEYIMKDPYVIDSIERFIKKKINQAKVGKLKVDGNYQIASGDPFALMQSICGLKVTGLLNKNECYSKYWIDRKYKELEEDKDKNFEELVIFRSPMTSHNNIRKCKIVNNKNVEYWYQYMDTIMIINGWDTFCIAENGCDWDR